jgi:asparagine synthase (glutamine-hydrolysing)
VQFKLKNLAHIVRLNENEPGAKTARYYEKTQDGKLLLRKVMERYIPRKITQGIKQGFSAPDASWFKGDSIEYIERKLKNRNARIYDYLDYKPVQALIDEHMKGKQNRRLFIWSLLSIEAWCETYL